MPLQLPARFKPTHQTAGLKGFPAVDVFAQAHTPVLSPQTGRVVKLSGHEPTPDAEPGGPYGWSIYLSVDKYHLPPDGGTYYLTHLGSRPKSVYVGACIARGETIGTVADYASATHGVTANHVHMGFHPGKWEA